MFNPFEKEITEITIKDIKILKEKNVAEGEFMEYKSDYPNPDKISHSIASFANSHGGWYIIGIKSMNNIPDEFNGIQLNRFGNDHERIRDIARSHINPMPRLETRVIDMDETGQGILVVRISESDEPPHITKDGKIYRRNGAGSDPVPENDRYAIDKLYEKANFIEKVKRFCVNDVVISKADAERSWLEIYIMTYPLDTFEIPDFFDKANAVKLHEFLNAIDNIGTEIKGNIPYDTFYPSQNSLIFRQTTPTNISRLGISYKQYNNGNCKIIIPFISVPLKRPGTVKTDVETAIYSKIDFQELPFFKIIDGHNLLSSYVISMMKHQEYLKSRGYVGQLLIFYKLHNTFRNILLLESPGLKNQIETHGVPICLQGSGQYPINISKESLLEKIREPTLVAHLSRFIPIMLYFGLFSETYSSSIITWIEKNKTI